MAELIFNKVYVNTIAADASISFSVPSGKIWKIESVGIGGTKGAVQLRIGTANVAILFSTFQDNDYGSKLPYWMDDTVSGEFINDSNSAASVSITEWNAETITRG
jgi:hypothetical protein